MFVTETDHDQQLWKGAKEELRAGQGHDCISVQESSTSQIQNDLSIHVTFAP